MKRRTFVAELNIDGRGTVAMATAHAWNSAARATEALVREHARETGQTFTAAAPPDVWGKPGAPGAEYRRTWRGDRDGQLVRIRMCEVFS